MMEYGNRAFMTSKMGGAFRFKLVGHFDFRWVGQLWQSELLLFERYAQKKKHSSSAKLMVPLLMEALGNA